MPPDAGGTSAPLDAESEARAQLTYQWLEKCSHDLRVAQLAGTDTQADLADIAAFHCQQAVEKALKANAVYLT